VKNFDGCKTHHCDKEKHREILKRGAFLKICPNCDLKLKPTRNQYGVLFTCKNCESHLVSVSLAKKTDIKIQLLDIMREFNSLSYAEGRRCPSCRKGMREVAVQTEYDSMNIDICKSCQAIWFDPQEYQASTKSEMQFSTTEGSALIKEKALALLELQADVQRSLYVTPRQINIKNETHLGPFQRIFSFLGFPIESNVKNPSLQLSVLFVAVVFLLIQIFIPLQVRIESYAFQPMSPFSDLGLRWITSFFMHASWIHLLGNMYFFTIFADNVEEEIGSGRLLVLLMVSHWLGCVGQMLFSSSSLPLVGASGGIFGVIAFYSLQFPKHQLILNPFGLALSALGHRLYVPAWFALIIFIFIEFIGLVMQIAKATSVSHFGHIFGGVGGVIYWLFVKKLKNY
jgi:membrane associated rhomboid family serine protease/Zn-finger nucleic acid-binding protein